MRIIAYVVAALLLFAGCAQDQPKEPAPTAKPSPTVTVPSMPPAAQENTVAGAVAFVEHYIDVFNYASNTGDVKELQRLSEPNCEGCTEYIELYEATYKAGGYYRDSVWKVVSIEPELQDGQPIVFGTIDVSEGRFKTKKGSPQQRSSAERSDLTFLPTLSNRSWRMKVLALQADSK